MIQFEVRDRELMRVIREIIHNARNPRPLMVAIGEILTESTKERFSTGRGPDGQRWVTNSEVTLLQYLRRYRSSFRKDGRLSKTGAARVANKRPLVGESRRLSSGITYNAGRDYVEVGSPMPYAAMMQFGGSKFDFPNLWGDIPARPYLGVSDADEGSILDAVSDFLLP